MDLESKLLVKMEAKESCDPGVQVGPYLEALVPQIEHILDNAPESSLFFEKLLLVLRQIGFGLLQHVLLRRIDTGTISSFHCSI